MALIPLSYIFEMAHIISVSSFRGLLYLHLSVLLDKQVSSYALVIIIRQDEEMPLGGKIDALCKSFECVVLIDTRVSAL
jgi:hypothetical protein